MNFGLPIIIVFLGIYLLSSIKILPEYERGVIFRLGRLLPEAFLRVIEPRRAVVEVFDYRYQTSQFAQTTLRSVLGEVELDGLLAHRDALNTRVQSILDQHTEPWGVKVVNVEVKQVDLPESMLRAMAKQAEAEREKRAKMIHAEGEFAASQRLADAAKILGSEAAALQLRYLQTLTEIGVEKNTTIVFPIPIDILSGFVKNTKQ